MSLFSALCILFWVLPQALNDASGVLSIISSMRAFTDDLLLRSICRPVQNVTTSIFLVVLSNVRCVVKREIHGGGVVGVHLQDQTMRCGLGHGSRSGALPHG